MSREAGSSEARDADDTQKKRILFKDEDWQAFFASAAPVDAHGAVIGVTRVPVSLLQPDLEFIAQSRSVRDVLRNSSSVHQRWQRSGLFRSVSWSLEPLNVPQEELEMRNGRDTNIVSRFQVEEAKMNGIDIGISTTSTMVPEFTAAVKNMFGRPLALSVALFPAKSKLPSGEIRLRSTMPFWGREAEYSVGRRIENRLTSSRPCAIADAEIVSEARSSLSFGSDEKSSMTITALLADRHTQVKELLSMAAPLAEEYRNSTKISLRASGQTSLGYKYSDDDKALLNLPVRGVVAGAAVEAFGTSSEVGSIDPSRGFLKAEGSLSWHQKLCSFLTVDVQGYGGLLWSLCGERPPLPDRFYLASRHLRGYRSVGPSTLDFCAERGLPSPRSFRPLGGDSVWALSTSLNFPLMPSAWSNGAICGHVFVNAGNVLQSWGKGAKDAASASLGCGLVASLPAFGSRTCGRLEANFGVPFSIRSIGHGGIPIVAFESDPNLFQKFRFGLHWSNAAVV